MKNNKTYFLFGDDAVREFEENGVDSLLANIQSESDAYTVSYELFEWTEGETTPQQLLYSFQGMYDFIIITEEEFNTLNQ